MDIQGADMELSPFYYNRGGQLHVRTLYYNLFCTNFEFSKISLNLRGVTIRLKKNKLTRKISFSKSKNLDPFSSSAPMPRPMYAMWFDKLFREFAKKNCTTNFIRLYLELVQGYFIYTKIQIKYTKNILLIMQKIYFTKHRLHFLAQF